MRKTRSHILKIALMLLVIIGSLASSCDQAEQKDLTIAVAANMQFAMPELINAFEESDGIKTAWIVSSSGKLTAQIKSGAKFDLFMSADLTYPKELYESGFTTNSPQVYAFGKLVLWSATELNELELNSLNRAEISHIAIANPAIAPYGRAAKEVLETAGLFENLKSKLVYGESISQVNQFINSEAAQVGFTSKSVVLSDAVSSKGVWIDLDSSLHSPIGQAAVILKNGEHDPLNARKFFEFLFSNTAKEILNKFGYSVTE